MGLLRDCEHFGSLEALLRTNLIGNHSLQVLAARSLSDAQGGTLLAGWIKITPIFLIVVPGMIRSGRGPGQL